MRNKRTTAGGERLLSPPHIAAVLMLLMTGLTVLVVINLWPLFTAAPVPSADANVPE
jgi:hypothetical protein